MLYLAQFAPFLRENFSAVIVCVSLGMAGLGRCALNHCRPRCTQFVNQSSRAAHSNFHKDCTASNLDPSFLFSLITYAGCTVPRPALLTVCCKSLFRGFHYEAPRIRPFWNVTRCVWMRDHRRFGMP
jgi:hypothetical protein